MNLQTEIIITSSIDEVTNLFGNQSLNRQWQENLIKYEIDEFDESKSLNFYQVNGRIVEVKIQILENNLPTSLTTVAQMKDLTQNVKHMFFECSSNQTIWVMETKYHTDSWLLKIIMLLMPSQFRKRVTKYMDDFKNFAETTKIVTEDLDKD